MIEAARGVEAYRSWRSVRPREMTGVVAYIGMRVKSGKCLQQCAKAAMCGIVACVRRMNDRVGTCLESMMVSTDRESLDTIRVPLQWAETMEASPLQFFQLRTIETFVPANVYENLNPAIKLEKRLGRLGWRLRAEKWCEGKHGCESWVSGSSMFRA